jgi:NADH:ubiquinone oxidoreductase subunit D
VSEHVPYESVRELATGVTIEGGDNAPVVALDEDREQEMLTVNFGPHHPATHGVLRLLVTLQGEVVRELHPYVGYVHTGIEKNCEDKSYWKVIPLVERMDYLAYHFNALAFCMATERLLDEEVPPRAQYLRVIQCELNRIHSHLVWLGTSALDLGAISIFWYCFREREKVLDLFEASTGQRMHTRYIQVGGVAEDVPPGTARCSPSAMTCSTASASTRRSSTATRSSSSARRAPASFPRTGCSPSA